MGSGKEREMMAPEAVEVSDPLARLSQEIRAVVEDNARFLARLRDDADDLEEEPGEEQGMEG